MAVDPRYVVFDGYALKYVEEPLPARVGEMVRVYFLNAGPTLNSAFHVIGTVFDAAYIDGNRANVLKGLQTIDVPPSGGAIMEFTFDEPGNNPFVTHAFAHASRGAVGIFNVTGESITGTVPPPTQVTTIRMVQGATYKTTDAYAPSPAIVKVGVNNTILFINDDVDIHTATVDQRPGVPASPEYFDTGLLSKGESKTITLTKPGTYYYYCLLHPAMVGTIQVLPADSH
jgi:plastocyanin